MSDMSDVCSLTRQIVADCNLHSASIFVCDRTMRRPELKYLFHVGISEEVQDIYVRKQIFHVDPFTDTRRQEQSDAIDNDDVVLGREVIAENRFPEMAGYWSFMDHYGIDVVGASTRRLLPGLYSTLGFHRRADRSDSKEVPVSRLSTLAQRLQNMVCTNMLRTMLENGDGQNVLRRTLYAQATDDAAINLQTLSPRENEIAQFVCQGRLNKEVAYLTGLSEHTVENHLRRIYRKLNIHNRTSLVAMMSRASTSPAH